MKTFGGITALLWLTAQGALSAAPALTLQTALQNTLEKNPEIQMAKLEFEQASGRRLVFRAIAWPDATIGVAAGVQGGHRAGEKAVQPFGFAYGGFIQPLFNAAVPSSLRRGDVELLIAQQKLNVTVIEQLHAARMAFYAALYNRSLKSLSEEQQRRLEENATTQSARYQSGLTQRNVVVSAQLQTRELDPRIQTADRAYHEAVLKLATFMADDLGAEAELAQPDGDLAYREVEVDVPKQAALALKERPDLILARLVVRAANEDQRIIEAGYYPVINATVSGDYIPVSGVRRQSEGSPRRSDDIISSEIRAGAGYTWRVIDNGKVTGAVMQKRAARKINEEQLRKLEADVPRELARIRNELRAIADKQNALKRAAGSAEESATTVRQNLAGGVVSPLEYRLAENALLQIKAGLLSLAFEQNVALAEWDRATGRYLQFSNETGENVQ